MTYEKSCGAIIVKKDQVFLVKQRKAGDYNFPKGHVEKNETEIQTAIREVKEETNIDITIYKEYRYEIHYNPKENVDKTVVFFLANNVNNNTKKQDEEIANIGWFKYDEALNILTYDDAKKLLKQSYKDLNNL